MEKLNVSLTVFLTDFSWEVLVRPSPCQHRLCSHPPRRRLWQEGRHLVSTYENTEHLGDLTSGCPAMKQHKIYIFILHLSNYRCN